MNEKQAEAAKSAYLQAAQVRVDAEDRSDSRFLMRSTMSAWFCEHAAPFASGVMLDYGSETPEHRRFFDHFIECYVESKTMGEDRESPFVLPYASDSFDTVLSTHTLERVTDPSGYLREAARVLRPEGKIILTVPMIQRQDLKDPCFFRFTKPGFKNLLEGAGFDVVRIDACGGLLAGVAQALLDALAAKGKVYPRWNAFLNPLIRKLDSKYRDGDFSICWMALARKVGTASHRVSFVAGRSDTMKCPICDSLRPTFAFQWESYSLFRCGTCDADFVSPSPTAAALAVAYNDPQYFCGTLAGGYSDYDEQAAPVLETFATLLDELESETPGRRLLDVGCAYGSHLSLAADRGWSPVGIEVSTPARTVAAERLQGRAVIFGSIGEMPPQPFDLVILMDVIEHMPAPRQAFYDLFSKGAITPTTMVVISTPNVRSSDAVAKGSSWEYYRPPYRVSYFSDLTMRTMLNELRFKKIEVRGAHTDVRRQAGFDVDLSTAAGIVTIASGSDFASFMQERYVPGTWSELTAYEHIPRYAFSLQFARDQKALDFGCGSGYGSATLAEVAEHVLAVDISDEALNWARAKHRLKNIEFRKVSDLGASLETGAFGLITCFEVIEHLSEADQKTFVGHVARLLDPNGVFVISTPNSLVTSLYGDNPFHLKELSSSEFRSLLGAVFPFVRLFSQKIRPGVSISEDSDGEETMTDVNRLTAACGPDVCEPAAYVAVCGKRNIDGILKLTSWDSSNDFIFETIKGFPRPRE